MVVQSPCTAMRQRRERAEQQTFLMTVQISGILLNFNEKVEQRHVTCPRSEGSVLLLIWMNLVLYCCRATTMPRSASAVFAVDVPHLQEPTNGAKVAVHSFFACWAHALHPRLDRVHDLLVRLGLDLCVQPHLSSAHAGR
jgi:hypothetical protein